MYQESQDLQTQVNALSEELRNVKMQLQALYKHFNLNVNAKREIVCYTVQEYLKPGTVKDIVKTNGLQGME